MVSKKLIAIWSYQGRPSGSIQRADENGAQPPERLAINWLGMTSWQKLCLQQRAACAASRLPEGTLGSSEHPSSFPVRHLFRCTGDSSWPLYQDSWMEGFTVPLRGGGVKIVLIGDWGLDGSVGRRRYIDFWEPWHCR